MKEKEIIIKAIKITPKQCASLGLELNLVVKAWRPYAALELKAPGLKKIIGWGTRRHDEK